MTKDEIISCLNKTVLVTDEMHYINKVPYIFRQYILYRDEKTGRLVHLAQVQDMKANSVLYVGLDQIELKKYIPESTLDEWHEYAVKKEREV